MTDQVMVQEQKKIQETQETQETDASQSVSVYEFPIFALRSTEVTEEFESILLQILSDPPTSSD